MKRIAIVLAGGQGTRLWPLSSEKRPKPLLEVFNHKTMLENTVMRAKLFADEIYVLIEPEKEPHVAKVIAELGLKHNIIVEPPEAGTAAAFAYGVARMKATHGDDAVVTFLPVDHQIKNLGAFYRDANYIVAAATQSNAVTLCGVTPSFPATGYGYIHLGQNIEQEGEEQQQYIVQEFLEKPDEATAKQFLKNKKIVWNSGIYFGTVRAFTSLFQLDEILYDWYQKIITRAATSLPPSLVDQQLEKTTVEQATNLRAVIATFDWSDIGTYEMLYQSALQTDEHNNALRGNVTVEGCSDSLILGRSKKIVALGLDDIAVIDGPDGFLVCKKSTYSQLVGKAATGKVQPGEHHG